MIERIEVEIQQLNFRVAILTVISALPYVLGWLVGFVMRGVLWLVAAIVAGYKSGRGE